MLLDFEITWPFYADLAGKPLQNGKVYYGVSGQNPVTNPVTVYWDAAGTQPAAQPINIMNGRTMRDGASAPIWVSGDYSLLVQDSSLRNVMYAAAQQAPLRIQLAQPTGSSLVIFQQNGTAISRTTQSKLRDIVDVRDKGAVAGADATSAIQAAITEHPSSEIWISESYIVSSTLNLNGFTGKIRFRGTGAKLLAGATNVTVMSVTTNAYGAQLIDPRIEGNGFAGVTALDLTRFQLEGAAIIRPQIKNCVNGIILRSLCWGLKIDHPYIYNTANPIISMQGNNAVQIIHPCIDTFTGNAGIDIWSDPIYPNVGTQILNGFIQGGTSGIRDAAYATQVQGTYFERCTVADVSLINGSFYFLGVGTNHTSTGQTAYKGRSVQAARILHPFMSSGGRTTGLFDFDGTNASCSYDVVVTADTKNTPLGTTLGISTIWGVPGAIGSVTPNSGAFTTLSASQVAALSGGVRAQGGTAATVTGVASTLFSIAAAARGQYDVVAMIANSGNPAQYASLARVIWDGSGGRIDANNGTGLTVTLSGANVQITQTSGANQNVAWSASFIAI